MSKLLPTRWRWIGGGYVGIAMMLAAFVVLNSHPNAFLVLLGITFPTGYVMYLPMYLATALMDSVLGIGLEGSSVTSTIIFVAGFGAAAALNVLFARFAVLGLSRYWTRSVKTPNEGLSMDVES